MCKVKMPVQFMVTLEHQHQVLILLDDIRLLKILMIMSRTLLTPVMMMMPIMRFLVMLLDLHGGHYTCW